MGGARRVSPIIAAVATTAATIAHAAPVDRTAWLERVERGRKDYAAFIEKASLSHPATATARIADPRPGLSYSDPTLRDGDIVVDGDRLVVFRNRRLTGQREPHWRQSTATAARWFAPAVVTGVTSAQMRSTRLPVLAVDGLPLAHVTLRSTKRGALS